MFAISGTLYLLSVVRSIVKLGGKVKARKGNGATVRTRKYIITDSEGGNLCNRMKLTPNGHCLLFHNPNLY